MSDDLADQADTIWTRPVRGARGPARDRTVSEIARAAIALADGSGLSAVSMRAVADGLGTGAGSLYRYVASREELLDLMAEEALAELPQRLKVGTWVDQLVTACRDLHDLHRRHAWLAEVSFRPDAVPGPNAMDWFERCLGILTESPAGNRAKMEALAMLNGVVILFSRQRASSEATRLFSAVSPHRHPHLVETLSQPAPSEGGPDLFERTVRALLLGLLTDDT